MSKAALYLRSSKDRSDVSIDAQRRELEGLAKTKNLTIVEEYADAVESGKTEFRPAFQKLLKHLRAPERAWSHLLMVDTSRLSRRRYVAQAFKHEAAKRGVTLLYAKVPETDPITAVILDAVFEAMDEVHSLMSREKGLAGMAENVRQGFRAGGRAPFGYRLKPVETGAMRDGAAVKKTVLEPDENAPVMKRYLQLRAAGSPRCLAKTEAGLKKPDTSLIGYEWNALTYAGCTVWNMHAERVGGVHRGGRKRRPRAKWLIQRDTHQALITVEEAEDLLERLEKSTVGRAVSESRAATSRYLLSGLLKTPANKPWHAGGDGSYRTAGKRLRVDAIEGFILQKMFSDMHSPEFVKALTRQARLCADADTDPARELRGESLSLNAKITRAMELSMQLQDPAPALRKIDEMETRRKVVAAEIARLEREYMENRTLATLTEDNIRLLLDNAIGDLQSLDRDDLKRVVSNLIERIELDPESRRCRIHYRLVFEGGESVASPGGSGGFPGESMASPRRSEAYPALRHQVDCEMPKAA